MGVIRMGFEENITWHPIITEIASGNFTPIISGNLHKRLLPGQEDLVTAWAPTIGYSLHDRSNIIEVAQYSSMMLGERVKNNYLQFSKQHLRNKTKTALSNQELLKVSFTQLASDLGYPKKEENPFRVLAKLPLPIYITTSHFTFLEEALKLENKKPVSEIANWRDDSANQPATNTHSNHVIRLLSEFFSLEELNSLCFELDVDYESLSGNHDNKDLMARELVRYVLRVGRFEQLIKQAQQQRPKIFWGNPPEDFEPSIESPLVYHLFGLETYPDSLVLTEDDCIEFLFRVAQDQQNRTGHHGRIHGRIYEVITDKPLLLLGYDLQDWYFKVLFNSLIVPRRRSRSDFNIAIQITPDPKMDVSIEQARTYLIKYFKRDNFTIYWGDVSEFISQLWQNWQDWQ